MNLKKNFSTGLLYQVKIFLYQIMIILLLLKLIKRCGTMEKSNCRESKKHSPFVVGCGRKIETTLWKSPSPFPYFFFFLLFIYLFIFSFIFISWRLITLQYCSGFCHTLTWISHVFTCIPHPDPPSHLPLYPIPLSLPSAPGLSTCLMHPTWAGDLFHPR